METAVIITLITLNCLQFCWLVGYKKYFNIKQTIFLTSFLVFQATTSFFLDIPVPDNKYRFLPTIYFFIPFTLLVSVIIFRSFKKFSLVALYLIYENTMLVISWFLSWGIFNFFWLSLPEQFYNIILSILLFQQLLFFVMILIIQKIDTNYKIFESFYQLKKNSLEQFFIGIILLLLAIIIALSPFFKFRASHFFYLAIFISALIGIFIYLFYLISQFSRQQQQMALLSKKSFQEKNRLELANEFRHDYHNILISLIAYLEQNQADKALAYLSSILDYSDPFIKSDYYTQVFLIDVPPVQGLLINFFERCNEKQVAVYFSINQKISEQNISINLVDFVRCLSILLDNALEAALTVKEPLIQVTFEIRNDSITIEVKNSIEQEILLEQILKHNYTTKKEHQGNGLYIFTRILNHSQKTSYSFKSENNFFIANFSLPIVSLE